MKTNLKRLRTQANLTQRELAARVGTNQQQIQRLEGGFLDSVKIDLAARLAEALGVPVEAIFPLPAHLRTTPWTVPGLIRESRNPKTVREFSEAGIDIDPATWTLGCTFRGDVRRFFPITTERAQACQRRLANVTVEEAGRLEFFRFTSGDHEVVVNLQHLVQCNVLFDPPNIIIGAEDPEAEQFLHPSEVTVMMAGATEPRHIEVNAEPPSEADRTVDDFTPLAILLMDLEAGDDAIPGFCQFFDIDGEYDYVRTADVAYLAIPRECLDPSYPSADGLDESFLDDDEEDEAGDDDDKGAAGMTPPRPPDPPLPAPPSPAKAPKKATRTRRPRESK